jgi:cell shape-determining protein MreD
VSPGRFLSTTIDRYTRTTADPKHRRQPKPGGLATYTSVLLAILVGIVHAGLAPVLVLGGVKPDIVLVAVVLVTTSFGFSQGIVWAFVAGTVANLLIPEPLGSVPLALLAVAAMVSAGSMVLGRLVWVYPIGAALAGSMVADFVSLGALAAVGGSLGAGIPFELIVPAAVLNAALTGLLLVPTRILQLRYRPEEKAAW